MNYIQLGSGLFLVACSVPFLAKVVRFDSPSWLSVGFWGSAFAIGGVLVRMGI